MKLGCCGSLDQATELKAVGFTFLEVNVQTVLKGEIPNADWDQTRPNPATFALPIPAANCLVPKSLPIVGPHRDMSKLQTYMQRVAQRAQLLGLRTLVLGSGGARKCPPDLGLGKAMDQIAEFAQMAGEVCRHHGLTIVVEHLNQSETNTLNKLSQESNSSSASITPTSALWWTATTTAWKRKPIWRCSVWKECWRMCTWPEPVDRIQPGGHAQGSRKAYDFVHFFRLLRRIGYDGLISFECKWTQPISQVGPATVAYLQECWTKRGSDRANDAPTSSVLFIAVLVM